MNPEAPSFSRAPGSLPEIEWFAKERPDADGDPRAIPLSKISFVHNLGTLVDMVQKDGGKVAIMPVGWRAGMREGEVWKERAENIRYALLFTDYMKVIAAERGALFIPFPEGRMDPSDWIDPVHLNSEGSRKKAAQVASFLLPSMNTEGSPDGQGETEGSLAD